MVPARPPKPTGLGGIGDGMAAGSDGGNGGNGGAAASIAHADAGGGNDSDGHGDENNDVDGDGRGLTRPSSYRGAVNLAAPITGVAARNSASTGSTGSASTSTSPYSVFGQQKSVPAAQASAGQWHVNTGGTATSTRTASGDEGDPGGGAFERQTSTMSMTRNGSDRSEREGDQMLIPRVAPSVDPEAHTNPPGKSTCNGETSSLLWHDVMCYSLVVHSCTALCCSLRFFGLLRHACCTCQDTSLERAPPKRTTHCVHPNYQRLGIVVDKVDVCGLKELSLMLTRQTLLVFAPVVPCRRRLPW